MTYNLPDFLNWLAEDPNHRQDLLQPELILTDLDDYLFATRPLNAIRANIKKNNDKKKIKPEDSMTIYTTYYNIVKEWMDLVDKREEQRERERERDTKNNMTITNIQNWLAEQDKINTKVLRIEDEAIFEGEINFTDWSNLVRIIFCRSFPGDGTHAYADADADAYAYADADAYAYAYADAYAEKYRDKSLIPSIKITNCPQLETVICVGHQAPEFSINNCPKVKRLTVFGNKITNLDTSKLSELLTLNCLKNPLNNLDISQNLKLKTFWCDENIQPIRQLTEKIQAKEKETNNGNNTKLQAEIQELKDLKTRLENQLEQKDKELREAQQEIRQLKDELATAKTKITQLERELDQVKTELSTAKSNVDSTKTEFKRISFLKEQLEQSQNTLTEEINRIVQSNKDYKENNAELVKSVEKLNNEKNDLQQQLEEQQKNSKNTFKLYNELLDAQKKDGEALRQKENELRSVVQERDRLKLDIQKNQQEKEKLIKTTNLQDLALDLFFDELEKESISNDLEEKIKKLKEEIKQVAKNKEICESMCKDLDNFVSFIKKRWELEAQLISKDQQIAQLQQENKDTQQIQQEKEKLEKQLETAIKEAKEASEVVYLAKDKFDREAKTKEQELNISLERNKFLENEIKEKELIIKEKEQQITKIKADYDQANNSALQTAGQLDAQKKANQELNEEIEKLKTASQATRLTLTTQVITMVGENEGLTNQLKSSQKQCQNLEQQITDLIINHNDKTQQSQTIQQSAIQEIQPLKTNFEKKLETVKGELREKVLEGSTDDYLSARELLVNIFTEFPELNSENLLSWIRTQQNNLKLLQQLKNKLGIGGETRLDELLAQETKLKDWEQQLSGISPQTLLLNSATAQQGLQETINRQENNIKILNQRNQELQNKLTTSQNHFNQQQKKLSELEKGKPITTSIETQTEITIPPPRSYWKYFWWIVVIVGIIGGGYWIYRKIRNWF